MKRLIVLLSFLLLTAAAQPLSVGRVQVCGAAPGTTCSPVDLGEFRPQGSGSVIMRPVIVAPEAMPLERPLMVILVATASSEVRWNGVVIGRNGVPGGDRASERPGCFVATFLVPRHLVRMGENRLSARLSAHHLWLPVRRVVHVFAVGPYTGEDLPGLSDYLPALLVLGALGAACAYFFVAALSDRKDRQPLLLALIAGSAMVQLGVEVSRAFISYSYPWHLPRLAAIALLAAGTSVMIALYAAARFAPGWRRRVGRATAVAAGMSVLFIPWFDLKALGAIGAGAAALGFCAVRALRQRRLEARIGLAAAALLLLLLGLQGSRFLDRAYYLLLAVLLVALVAEQVANLRRARLERDAEARRSAALAERLRRAEREGEPIVALKEGTRTHRVAEGDILYVKAADDYCEVVLRDGRTLLVTMSLSRLLAGLPERFVRVHKSYAVYRPNVTAMAPKPAGGRVLVMSDGVTVPVGRSYGTVVASWLDGQGRS